MTLSVRSLALMLGSIAALMPGCSASKTQVVHVYGAASTREALEEIASGFQAQTGIRLELNFGASSDLARQIEHGAAAELFLSADESWADYLANKGLVEKRHDLLTNRLVVIVPADSRQTLRDLRDLANPGFHRLALAGPAVPAGRYARESLQHAEIWELVKNRVLDAGDVRAAFTYVVRGEADAAFVYGTDIRGDKKVRSALDIKPEFHAPIRYPLVLIRQSSMNPTALTAFDYLTSQKAETIFRKWDFGVLGGDPTKPSDRNEGPERRRAAGVN